MTPALRHVDKTMEFDKEHRSACAAPSITELAVVDKLEKQQKDRSYDVSQHRVHSKSQMAFVAGTNIHQQNLPMSSL